MKEPPAPVKAALFVVVFTVTFAGLWVWTAPTPVPLGPAATPPKMPTMAPVVLPGAVPNYGPLPEFSLLDSRRNGLTKARLAGKLWVASFLFTHCAGTCPIMASRSQMLQASLPEGVVLVSISVDPDRDTPEVLEEWGKTYERDPAKWTLATGDFVGINQLMRKGFHLPGDDPLLHSTGFVLVDGAANIRGYYEALQADEMPRLLQDIALVLRETAAPPAQPPPDFSGTEHAAGE